MRHVESPYADINLNFSNFVATSDEEQYQQIEAFIPYVTHTHNATTLAIVGTRPLVIMFGIALQRAGTGVICPRSTKTRKIP